MTSYRNYSTIGLEEKEAAKEKKSVNNQKFLQMFHGTGTCFTFFQKESLAAGGKNNNK